MEDRMKRFKKVKWKDIEKTQKQGRFYIKGVNSGNIFFYGPYTIDDISNRRLRNQFGATFMHYPNDLYVEEGSRNGFCYEEV